MEKPKEGIAQFIVNRGTHIPPEFRYALAWFREVDQGGAGFEYKRILSGQVITEVYGGENCKILMCDHLWRENERRDKSQSEELKNQSKSVCGVDACICKK